MPRYYNRLLGICLGLVGCMAIISGCTEVSSNTIPDAYGDRREIVVFDVDGTLTPTITEIYTARQDAAKAVQKYADNGYHIVYLSARPLLFQGAIPTLLNKNGFPHGDIIVPKTDAEQDNPTIFKARVLNEYRKHGWGIVAAYGDSDTDFLAYANAKIPKERVFALQRAGKEHCEHGTWEKCLSVWTEHLEDILQEEK